MARLAQDPPPMPRDLLDMGNLYDLMTRADLERMAAQARARLEELEAAIARKAERSSAR